MSNILEQGKVYCLKDASCRWVRPYLQTFDKLAKENTLAYYEHSNITVIKSFIPLVPVPNVKNFLQM